VGHSFIAHARNILVTDNKSRKKHQSLDKKISHYLMIDGDVDGFTLADVDRMIGHDVDIISGAYPLKDKPLVICAGAFVPGQPGLVGSRYGRDLLRGKQCVDWVGAGFLLIRREALERMDYPWFREVMVDFGEGEQDTSTEDIGFCVQAQRAGIEVWCDFDVRLNHRK